MLRRNTVRQTEESRDETEREILRRNTVRQTEESRDETERDMEKAESTEVTQRDTQSMEKKTQRQRKRKVENRHRKIERKMVDASVAALYSKPRVRVVKVGGGLFQGYLREKGRKSVRIRK